MDITLIKTFKNYIGMKFVFFLMKLNRRKFLLILLKKTVNSKALIGSQFGK